MVLIANVALLLFRPIAGVLASRLVILVDPLHSWSPWPNPTLGWTYPTRLTLSSQIGHGKTPLFFSKIGRCWHEVCACACLSPIFLATPPTLATIIEHAQTCADTRHTGNGQAKPMGKGGGKSKTEDFGFISLIQFPRNCGYIVQWS